MPLIADTTTIVGSFLLRSFTIAITLLIASALPTELPPNFKTCIQFILSRLY